MYHPALIAEQEAKLLAQPGIKKIFPKGFPEYSIDDCRALTAQIASAEQDGQFRRRLTDEEDRFITMAKMKAIYDCPWYLQVFVWIDEEGHGIRPLYPLWESQRFVLDRLASLEYEHKQTDYPDGLLVNILKARQLGISTLAEALVSHRIFTQPYIRAIAGSDVERQAVYLFSMVERIYSQLPFFLKPARSVPYAVGKELTLGNHSSLKAAWGKTTRGALQDTGGKKGNIERGRTNSVVHISELATWDNPEQLDSSLLPGIPTSRQSLVLFESTAELAGDWWHRHWLTAGEGQGRFRNLFIPWCVEPQKYSLPAPEFWEPNEDTQKVANTIERDIEQWVGEKIVLIRDQLYWYETTRAYYTKKNQLHQFFKEFPSNPEECFQYAGRSVFSHDALEEIDHAAKPILDVWACEPSREIAELRHANLDDLRLDTSKRAAPPITTRMSTRAAEVYPVPPGYGFRRLGKSELAALPSLRHSVMSIYEYPRSRGDRRYIMAVDVGDGLGLDYSVITVIRQPTIEEPAEDVAQYVSNRVKPSQLAYIADAIGRFYTDVDGIEALAAVELNAHGATVQDLLQLHLGYGNFYVWEVVDAADPGARFTRRIGWVTSPRTRPLLLEKFHDAVTTIDPVGNFADFRINSPVTRQEMRFFVTESTLGEAEHARGQHDDCIFSAAIGYYVAHRMAGGEAEPIAERRHRRDALKALAAQRGPRDYRNTAITAEDADATGSDDFDSDDDYFSDRDRA